MTQSEHSRGWLAVILIGILAVSFLGLAVLWHSRTQREREDAAHRQGTSDQGAKLFVVPVEETGGERSATLPAEVKAFLQTTLYAKVSGYLQTISVDKGDLVKRGQLLGTIESPETDQQVAQAQSQLALSEISARRTQALIPQGVISRQEFDQAQANLKVTQASVAQVKALQAYETLRAPFDGVITARYVDKGALLQNALPLVDVASIDRVKVTAFIGQDIATFVKVGDLATIVQDEKPERPIEGTVTRCSSAIDPRSRTMLCEIWLDNRQYRIYPGTYVHITLHVKAPALPTIPSEALFSRGEALLVAVVKDKKLKFVTIEPGMDDGKRVQIRSGLSKGDQVALNVPTELADGATVQPLTRSPEKSTPAK